MTGVLKAVILRQDAIPWAVLAILGAIGMVWLLGLVRMVLGALA
jgi:hypothetical protein